MRKKKVLILGVTASGKSRLSFELAESLQTEIISIDSMKVYRRMDIGTAKPPVEAQEKVKYHLIDVVEPSESFNVNSFVEMTNEVIGQLEGSDKQVIAAGGTALYIKALLYGLFDGPGTDERIREKLKAEAESEGLGSLYSQLERIDPAAAERIHPNDAKRVVRALEVYELTGKPISSFQQQWGQQRCDDWIVIGLRRERQDESKRINARVKRMIESGLVDEVKSLLAEPKPLSKQARGAIGYAEIIDHLEGKMSLDEAVEMIKKNSRHLAKHQRTWFKTFNVNWLDIEEGEEPEQILARMKEIVLNF
ncbi:tRNA (adenosine(37)-N6)-dimethylallyltransferase MiaA [Planctomycetota bacterium]